MNKILLTAMKQIPLLKPNQRFIFGVDGLSRAGKTTFVKRFIPFLESHALRVCAIHMDDHIVSYHQRYHTGHPEWVEYYRMQWHVDGLSSQLFQPLRAEDTLVLPFYDKESDLHHTQTIHLPQTGVVIVEGIFLQRPEWRSYFDFVLYLDCAREKRFSRENKTEQKNRTKFENRYWKAEDYYIDSVNPTKTADLVFQI
ncbi:hypothetical protein IC620_06585 [Hazenella sp. IB182357]|uniref:Phosphoribulokinase/uridine kinase domain-containing protein n=1 Tax=Polycladospora coralii TaxID=2771432 RepID=A0A926N6G5_9BACL|nr:kinase [Polycladospora coralii]MBD1372026.1 hypothetical protein [Polycladospora coralii]MBS7530532.1 hypothetical protein [Polycladospora coralii]